MPKVLVTGGAGFIGSNVVDGYINQGWDVVVIDNLSSGNKEQINPEASFYRMSVLDENVRDVFAKEKFDLVNHHAAQINVRTSVNEPIFDARENVLGSLNLLEICKAFGVKNFIFISSGGAIYGEPSNLPVKETYAKSPLSPYGINKLTVEFYLYFYKKVSGLNYVSLRYANIYGPRQDPLGEAGVVAIFSNAMLNEKKPTIFGDGKQTRDYVYVNDVVEANLLASQEIERLNNKKTASFDDLTYNIGMGEEESVNSLYQKLAHIAEFNQPPLYSNPREGEVKRICLDSSKAKKELGWEAKTALEEGLKKTVEWVLTKI
ncbi:NAD-dependent epimerase/dehydratase family protein [Candidatus Aerophobetes bacterium]|nr:NAD-dependent epimerase/dehydratase family protein [Candidatus Aerophobetes bacterium]